MNKKKEEAMRKKKKKEDELEGRSRMMKILAFQSS